ncbi:DUF177 domain-containing protein [uncultured Ilyobacter sp.]|uniref:YceD family protein n=1 Tax=uncultured Ilyobacter sp. TaxID=544433 RepID=UPI0029C71A32|nr:DUF177 domain-containing protein [uncultured Ilyobacter sp.]
MIIKIDEIRASQKHRLNFNFTVSKIEGLTLTSPAEIKGYAKVENEGFFVCGEYSSKIKTPCVRCLKEISLDVSGEFQGYFVESKSFKRYLDSLEAECKIDDVELGEAVDGEIDVARLVREHIILEMSPYPVCKPECGGLEEMEIYKDDDMDLRWKKLFELKN